MAREFSYDGRSFPDPDPSKTPDQIREEMTSFFPDLANATIEEVKDGDRTIYKFVRRVGTKGS
jgi:PRTRC genetic system protein C